MTTDSTRDETMDVERDAIYWKERYEIERGEVAPLQQALQQARAERDAAVVACQRISGYAGLIIKDGLKDHTFYRIENIKALADEQISAWQALTSMERGQNAG